MSISLTKIGTGKYSDVFRVQKDGDIFAMKISYYREETVTEFSNKMSAGDVKGAKLAKDRDAISVSCNFSKITEDFRTKGITPHFIRVFESRDVKNFVEKIPDMQKRITHLSPFQKKYNHVVFMEIFESDMTTFLTENDCDEDLLRMFIFQIVFTIAAAQKKLPGWRHNDLSTNNVLVKKADKEVATKYTCGGKSFYTKMNHFVSITDYDFVHVPSVKRLENHRVLSGDFKVSGSPNVSYDTHFFLKSVLKCLSKRHSKGKSTRDFFKRLDLKTDDRYPEEIPYLNPMVVLQDEYFEPMTKKIRTDLEFAF
jgi:hypothetical protein